MSKRMIWVLKHMFAIFPDLYENVGRRPPVRSKRAAVASPLRARGNLPVLMHPRLEVS